MDKSKQSRFFTPLAVHVAAGQSVRSAAAEIGCAEQTAYNLSCRDDFRQAVSAIRSAAAERAVGRLADSAALAVDTMRSLLDESNEPAIRLNAAKAILGALPGLSEFSELRQRIEQIERQEIGLRVAR